MSDFKVCVIGAGVSGLVACKYLKQSNISFDCFEKSKYLGGLWNIENQNIYESLHINTPKESTAFEDFPMSETYPVFASHQQILNYLLEYVHRYDLLKEIQFQTEVVFIEKRDDKYIVKLANGIQHIYDYVIIATGHHTTPQIVKDLKKNFAGTFLHSSEYRSSKDFQAKKILVIGIGNSAVDIACDLAKDPTNQVEISTRNSTYIYPHYVFGKPLGALASKNPIPMPKFVKRWIGHIILRLSTGNQQKLGIPKPTFKLLDSHSTVSTDIFALLSRGRIKFRSGIQNVAKNNITFSDSTAKEYDVVIACTGFKISLPFLSEDILNNQKLEKANHLDLYKRIVLPEFPEILLVGFVQPNYSVFRTSEEQVKWIIALLKSKFKLPSINKMEKEIAQHQVYNKKNFYNSLRHTIQVDFHKYKRDLERDYK